MSTFNKKNDSYDFWKIYWGPDEAKGDDKLPSYFLRIPEYEQIKQGSYRYIIGRKGTGKTAIIEKIISEIEGRHDTFYKPLSLKNFPLQTIRGLKDKSLGGKSQFVPIWSFLIVVELCKLLIEDQNAQPYEDLMDIKTFIDFNFPDGIGFTETLKTLEQHENKVSILAKWIGTETKSTIQQETLVPIHYQRAYEIICTLLKKINSDCKFYIFFDELDEGYNAGDSNLNLLLLALFRSVENCYIELKNYIKFIPILTLRSDIFNNLEDNDLNKLDDYLIHLRWTTESKSPYSLYQLVNQRIIASLPIRNNLQDKAWELVSFNNDYNLPMNVKTLWDYIYNRTFERPRDIVKFLKYCGKLNFHGKVGIKAVQLAENEYSDWFYREFRDEIQSHLNIWQESTQAIMKVGKGVMTVDEIKREFDRDSAISNYLINSNKKHEDILEQLFEFGLIGTLSDSGKWFFRYKDYNLPFISNQKIILHFGFSRKFRIHTNKKTVFKR